MTSEALVFKVAEAIYEQVRMEVIAMPKWTKVHGERREAYKRDARAALAVVEAEQGWEYAIRAKEGIIAAGYDNIAVAEFDAATATENPPGDLEVVRRHPASEWEACE